MDGAYEDGTTRKGMDGDEILSGVKGSDRLIPVITLVVYYGERPWDAPTSLHGMLETGGEIAPFVNDYKLLLVEARKNGLKLHHINNVDLFNLLGIFLDSAGTVNETRTDVIECARADVMCSFFEKLREEGVQERRAEEIIGLGFGYGFSEEDILGRLQRKLGVSLRKAEEYLGMFRNQMV